MFVGEYQHSLDAKGRVILPTKYRDALQGAYLTREVDGCLAMWTAEKFETRAEEMSERWRGGPEGRPSARAFLAGAVEASPDGQGRVAIPANLRDFAHLTKEVAIIGQHDHIEIWDASRWAVELEKGIAAMQGSH